MQSTLERAFELARTGPHGDLSSIRRQLVREKYDHVDPHLSGVAIRKQLNAILQSRREVG